MLVEVAAHARWITALDLAPDSGRLLSVGEDSLVRVWQITEEQPMVEKHIRIPLLFMSSSLSIVLCIYVALCRH